MAFNHDTVIQGIREQVEEWRDNEVELRSFGLRCSVEMSHELFRRGAPTIHYSTLNTEATTTRLLSQVGVGERAALRRFEPWSAKRPCHLLRHIHWSINGIDQSIDLT